MISGREYDDKLKKITKHFGVETELMKLSEELGELQNECYKRLYVDPEAGNVEDEFADVLVVLSQLLLYFNVDINKVSEIFEHKVDRTVKRIEEVWYNRHR